MIYNRVLDELKLNKHLREQGKDIAIPFPFERFGKFIPGIQKGRYIIVTANSKVGKSKITDFMFMYTPIEYVINRADKNVKIIYFTLEMSKEDKIKELISYLLYKYYGYLLSPEQLSSVFKDVILPDEILKILVSKEFTTLIEQFESRIEFIDNVRNPYGIYKHVREFAHKNGRYYDKYKRVISIRDLENNSEIHSQIDHYSLIDPNLDVIIITDHLSLLTPEKGNTLHDAMGDFSSNYSLLMRDRWKFTVVNVQQQAGAQESIENLKLDRLQPSANGLGDNKLTGRDCDMMLGLFAPIRYKIPSYEGYDIKQLRDNHRELSVILNRRGPAVTTQLFFNGASNYFDELPPYEEFQKRPELYKEWTI